MSIFATKGTVIKNLRLAKKNVTLNAYKSYEVNSCYRLIENIS